jgi:hypothetical protein
MYLPSPVAMEAMDIVVTGSRRMAKQEELGDLKLYRFPTRVTVASQAQKQVAMLHRPAVTTRVVYRQDVSGGDTDDMRIAVTMQNRTAGGLGVPLPAGRVAVFQPAGGRRVLLDTVSLDDKTVGEKVELLLPAGPGVRGAVESRGERGRIERYRLTVTNANPWPVAYEARLRVGDDERLHIETGRIASEDGRKVWAVTVPANGTVTLDYGVEDTD